MALLFENQQNLKKQSIYISDLIISLIFFMFYDLIFFNFNFDGTEREFIALSVREKTKNE